MRRGARGGEVPGPRLVGALRTGAAPGARGAGGASHQHSCITWLGLALGRPPRSASCCSPQQSKWMPPLPPRRRRWLQQAPLAQGPRAQGPQPCRPCAAAAAPPCALRPCRARPWVPLEGRRWRRGRPSCPCRGCARARARRGCARGCPCGCQRSAAAGAARGAGRGGRERGSCWAAVAPSNTARGSSSRAPRVPSRPTNQSITARPGNSAAAS